MPLERWVAGRGPLSLNMLHDSLNGAQVAGVLLLVKPLERARGVRLPARRSGGAAMTIARLAPSVGALSTPRRNCSSARAVAAATAVALSSVCSATERQPPKEGEMQTYFHECLALAPSSAGSRRW